MPYCLLSPLLVRTGRHLLQRMCCLRQMAKGWRCVWLIYAASRCEKCRGCIPPVLSPRDYHAFSKLVDGPRQGPSRARLYA